MLYKLKGAGHCASAKHMTSILRHVAGAFSPARQGTIINSHRVIGIATGAKLRLSDLQNHYYDSRCRTAGCSLTSYPGLVSRCVCVYMYIKYSVYVFSSNADAAYYDVHMHAIGCRFHLQSCHIVNDITQRVKTTIIGAQHTTHGIKART